MYSDEKEMYPHVRAWLEKLLQGKFKRSQIHVEDTSRKNLSRWLAEKGYDKYFPDYQTYEIEVDVTGIIVRQDEANLAFVECKLDPITLRDISQLLGYSKVANPILSVITSPSGVSGFMQRLFNVSRRTDVLNYSDNKHIKIVKWNKRRLEPDISSIIPSGDSLL